MGDAASAEQGGPSRLIDASTARVELRLPSALGSPPSAAWHDWSLAAGGVRLPLRAEADGTGAAGLYALRYRTFVPARGLHPALPAQAPLVVVLRHSRHGVHRLERHEWLERRPDGSTYDDLLGDMAEAAQRRAQRPVLTALTADAARGAYAERDPVPRACAGPYLLDLRALA